MPTRRGCDDADREREIDGVGKRSGCLSAAAVAVAAAADHQSTTFISSTAVSCGRRPAPVYQQLTGMWRPAAAYH